MERFVSVVGGMTRNEPLGLQELQEAMQMNHQGALVPPSYHDSMFDPLLQDAFCFGVGSNEQVNPAVPLFNANENEYANLGNIQWSNDLIQRSEGGTERGYQVYQRMKWNDNMVKILITAVSYVEEDALSYSVTTEKDNSLAPPIKGKWRAISGAMTEKGHLVSPQQCEDKFNDLNKRYKRLNEILGKGIAYEIVKNPSLVDVVNISEEAKDEVRKLLGSKQLYFREMFSFHNKNREYLPYDEGLKKTVQSSLRGKVQYMSQDVGEPSKRQKQMEGDGVPGCSTLANRVGESSYTLEAVEGVQDLDLPMDPRSVELQKKALLIQKQMLELEKSRIEWMKWCDEEDTKLYKVRLGNELMKLENKRLAYEIECKSKGYVSKT